MIIANIALYCIVLFSAPIAVGSASASCTLQPPLLTPNPMKPFTLYTSGLKPNEILLVDADGPQIQRKTVALADQAYVSIRRDFDVNTLSFVHTSIVSGDSHGMGIPASKMAITYFFGPIKISEFTRDNYILIFNRSKPSPGDIVISSNSYAILLARPFEPTARPAAPQNMDNKMVIEKNASASASSGASGATAPVNSSASGSGSGSRGSAYPKPNSKP